MIARAIQDNVLIVHEIFHSFRVKKGKEWWIAIKLDIEKKSMTEVNKNFIFEILQKFGFYSKFVGLIRECVTVVSFSVLVHDGPSDIFQPRRELRQGDL